MPRGPARLPAGKTSDDAWAFWDFLPTCAELAGVKPPVDAKLDGLSVLPALLGGPMPRREYFYWELHEPRVKQAVRFGDWETVRDPIDGPIELFDLMTDPGESHSLAADRPELVAKAEALLKSARTDSPLWPVKAGSPKTQKQ